MAFNPKLIAEKDLPKSVLDFAGPEWQGKVGFVPTSGAFQEQAVAIIKLHGRDAAEEWLTGLRAFGKVYSNNMVALKAVENGEVATVLVNNYYWFALEKEKGKLDSKLHYFTDGDAGGLITVSSAGVIKASKHPKEAQQLLAYMASEEGQRVITNTTAEYPMRKGMVSDRGLVQDGDKVLIDIPNRSINLLVSDEELATRRAAQDKKGWKPVEVRPRKVTTALKAYALLATSADKGAVRDKALLDKLVP